MKKTSLLLGMICISGVAAMQCLAQEQRITMHSRPATATFEEKQRQAYSDGSYTPSSKANAAIPGFRYAAASATPAVVHIMASYKPGFRGQPIDPFTKFYSDELWPNSRQSATRAREGSASGVLLSNDGYIVTNYHVVKNAAGIDVVLQDQRSYEAKIIGGDSLTDLALIKIAERDLPFITFGSTDSVAVGDWVLAIGNPFSLVGTATAGIVSSKAREINTIEEQGGLYSFIQTDAAMNDGNSGGALVDVNGKLIGINTGIFTPSGTYTGYAFSIPVDIVKKVSNDLLQFGRAERGYMGVYLNNIPDPRGLHIDSLIKNGAAMRSGIRPNDLIIMIDGQSMRSTSRFHTLMLLHRPGDKLKVTLIRNGKLMEMQIILDDQQEVAAWVAREYSGLLKLLGVEVITLPEKEQHQLKVTGGVKVIKVRSGKIYRSTNIEPGFIIMYINNQPIENRKDFLEALADFKGEVLVGGIYADYPSAPYYYSFTL